MPAVTDKDILDLQLAIQLDIDWIAVSFIRNVEDWGLAGAL